MAAEKERNGMYKSAYRHMLTELELVKATKPEKYNDVAEYVEKIRKYFIDAADVNDFEPVPKD